MLLVNPDNPEYIQSQDDDTKELLLKTIHFFEQKGKIKLKKDIFEHVWFTDFLEFQKKEKLFATFLIPPQYGDATCRWDLYRNCQLSEIFAFFGFGYWYTWQSTLFGLNPIWLSPNEELKQKAACLLQDGMIFGFGLSEKDHGSDLASMETILLTEPDGTYKARGIKYFVGNGNAAAFVPMFGRIKAKNNDITPQHPVSLPSTSPPSSSTFPPPATSLPVVPPPLIEPQMKEDYVIFGVDPRREQYQCVQNILNAQYYLAEIRLNDYPITEQDILVKGASAWDITSYSSLIGISVIPWAAIGMCTHSFYETINQTANRMVFDQYLIDFPHIQHELVEVYSRLMAMRLAALRAIDYFRAASPMDTRYQLYIPLVTLKTAWQGEETIQRMWDIMGTRGCEKDTFFESASKDIHLLARIGGNLAINVPRILKQMHNYLFSPRPFPDLPRQTQNTHDTAIFSPDFTIDLENNMFHDFRSIFQSYQQPNVIIFRSQYIVFTELLQKAEFTSLQMADYEILFCIYDLFANIVYGQLILESARLYKLKEDVVDQIFEVLVQDFSEFAVALATLPLVTSDQRKYCIQMIQPPSQDQGRQDRVWDEEMDDCIDLYEMNPE